MLQALCRSGRHCDDWAPSHPARAGMAGNAGLLFGRDLFAGQRHEGGSAASMSRQGSAASIDAAGQRSSLRTGAAAAAQGMALHLPQPTVGGATGFAASLRTGRAW